MTTGADSTQHLIQKKKNSSRTIIAVPDEKMICAPYVCRHEPCYLFFSSTKYGTPKKKDFLAYFFSLENDNNFLLQYALETFHEYSIVKHFETPTSEKLYIEYMTGAQEEVN
jgi:hypothetical protein